MFDCVTTTTKQADNNNEVKYQEKRERESKAIYKSGLNVPITT